jgi:DNA polymerase I
MSNQVSLPSLTSSIPKAPSDLDYDSILNLMSIQKHLTIDTESGETVGMLGIASAFDGLMDTGFYMGWNHDDNNLDAGQKSRLSNILSDERKSLIFHNAPYDLKVLEKHGVIPRGRRNFYCTMLMVHWVNENLQNYSLDAQSKAHGGKPKNRSRAMQHIIDVYGWDGLQPLYGITKTYSANDAWITHDLFRKVLPEFLKQGFDGPLWEVEEEFIWVIINMIELGIKIDLEFCVREMLKGETIMNQMRSELMMNPGSSLGLKKLLIDELQLPVIKETPGGKPSFDKTAMAGYDLLLEHQNDERAKKILRYRGWQKTVSSNYKAYLNLRDNENVLHPGYKLHGTETGRLSCEKPNLQQIPKSSTKEWNGNLKKAFIAREGFALWEVDYSQLEYRLTVAYADEEELREIFNDDSRDVFQEQANAMGWIRQNVKTLVYLILFGGGANRASVAFNVPLDEGKEIVETFHRRYPGIRKISRSAQNLATKRGFVKYWTGRRRHFPKGSAYYRAFNSIIQGGESEIVKRAMIKLAKTVCNEESCRMVLQVHDSVVFEIAVGQESRYLPRIIEAMEAVDFDFGMRFKVDAHRWGEG